MDDYTFIYTYRKNTPDSTLVNVIFYNEITKQMVVGLNADEGRVHFYGYRAVDRETFDGLGKAISAGRYYNFYIKGRYSPFGPDSDAPWTFVADQYAKASDNPELISHSAPPVGSSALKEFELGVDVRSKGNVKATSLQDAIERFLADPAAYLDFEVTGAKQV